MIGEPLLVLHIHIHFLLGIPMNLILVFRHINRYLTMTIVLIIILLSMIYALYSSNQMINSYSPQVDATMEIKYELTIAHLWFEEIISGGRHENLEDVMKHIEQGKWYANAMIYGGENSEGNFKALDDPDLITEVESILKNIKEFSRFTTKRWKSYDVSGIDVDIDQQYHRLFQLIITGIDNVETLIQRKINQNFNNYLPIQLGLILSVLILGGFTFRMQFIHDRDQRLHIKQIKEAKDSAQNNEQRLKTIMNSMGDGVIITDHNANVTYLNPVASSLTGWLLNDAKGEKMTTIFNIVNEYTKEPADDPVTMVIKNNVVVGLANHTELIAKDGTIWPISDSAAPIFDQENNLIGVVVVFHEITAQKKAEAEKEKLETELRQAYKMEAIGTMAGGIAHDFNNILAVILGNAEMAIDSISSENPARYNVDQILQASSKAKELVKQILTFSRREKKAKEPLYLCMIIEESIKSLRSTIPSSVNLKINFCPHCDGNPINCKRKVLADPIQIHQIILNLFVNAVQAMDEKGDISVTINYVTYEKDIPSERAGLTPGNYSYFTVADNGPGIDPETIKKIFDPFFTTKSVELGTGMGLSVVFGIIENHGGKIFVESVLNSGTIFHLYFPITMESKITKKIIEPVITVTGNEQILIVDDEETVVEMAQDMLERMGYQVTGITSSKEALELVKDTPDIFDLVLTDQTMPQMTGAELSEQLLKIRPDLPIILCTGYSSKVDAAKAKKIGIKEFATKPLRRKEITELIRTVLNDNSQST
jgi:PAS domain S-box-containing protein